MRRISIPQGLLIAAALFYGASFALVLAVDRPGLGVGQSFYVPVILAAAATSPAAGALAGSLALLLYELAIHNGRLALVDFGETNTLTRLAGFIAAGLLVGFLARRGRRMLAQSLYVLEELLDIAQTRVDAVADSTD